MSGVSFWFLITAGVVLDRLWLHRDVVAAWLIDAVDWLTEDPPPAKTLAPPRSHVRPLRQLEHDDLGPA